MKKILLIRTITDFVYWRTTMTPLGLLYIAAMIRERFPSKYDIKIIDLQIQRLSLRKMEDAMRAFNPDIVGCSVLSVEDHRMNELADLAKKINRDIKFIIGGPHPTMYCEDALRNDNVDIAVMGEGEETICELLEALEHGKEINTIPGLAFKKDGKIIKTSPRNPIEDLDILPFPAWDLIPIADYSKFKNLPLGAELAGKRYVALLTSRGCPYQCAYCHNMFGKVCRQRSPENVMREILELHNKYGVDELHIIDDIFNLDKKRTIAICDLIISSGIKIWISFPNALRADILDEEVITKLKAAGAYYIMYALETASPRIQKMLNKNVNIEKFKAILEGTDKKKVLTKCFFMIGFPSESLEEARRTIDFACKSPACYASFISVIPQKSTPLFEMVKKEYPEFIPDLKTANYLTPGESYMKTVVKFPSEKLIMSAYLRFFLNPKRLIKILLRTERKIFLFVQIYLLATMYLPYCLKRIFQKKSQSNRCYTLPAGCRGADEHPACVTIGSEELF